MNNPSMTVDELAKKLGRSPESIRPILKRPKPKERVDWKTFEPSTHLFQMMSLLKEMGEKPYEKPFIDGDKIILRMSSDYAFIFDMEGEAVQ